MVKKKSIISHAIFWIRLKGKRNSRRRNQYKNKKRGIILGPVETGRGGPSSEALPRSPLEKRRGWGPSQGRGRSGWGRPSHSGQGGGERNRWAWAWGCRC